jgi:hypothetical protein
MFSKRYIVLSKIQIFTVIVFFIFVFLYAFAGYHEEILPYKIVIQNVYAFVFFLGIYFSYYYKLNIKVLLIFIFALSIASSVVLRECYWIFTSTPFGIYEDRDIYDNYDIIINSMRRGYDVVMQILSQRMIYNRYHYDDHGMLLIFYFIYSLAGNENIGQYLALLFNSLAVTISTYYLYKLMISLSIKRSYARFFSSVWGFFPFLSVVSANGMQKENFFCLFIILSFYCMYNFKMKKRILSFIYCLFFIFCCSLFRIAISIMMLISFIILLIVNVKNSKKILNILFICLLLGIISLSAFMKFIFSLSLESYLSKPGQNIFYQILIALIGPLPNFNRSLNFEIFHNSGLLFKVIISFPFWMGIWYIIRTFNYKYYYLVAYIFMGLLMCIVTGYSYIRFQVAFFPLMLPIIAYAFQFGLNKICYNIYSVLSIFVIILYNNR